MTWTNDPKPNPKWKLINHLDWYWRRYFHFPTSVVWPPYASPFPRFHLCFRLWPLCSPLSVVIYSFCSLSIRSRFQIKSWSTIFSSSPFGSHDRSFDPSMVDEEPVLAMCTFSFGIVVFPKFAFFGVSSSCFGISTFILDGSLTSAGPSKSSNVSFHHWSAFGP